MATLTAGLEYVVNVTNSGEMAASKVVSAYVSYANMADGPLKQLFAMEKVRLAAGESALVTIKTDSLPGTCTFCSVDVSHFVAFSGVCNENM